MKKPLYITQEGVIYRKGNTIYFQNKDIKKVIPVNTISDIFCNGSISIRAGASHLLMKLNIPVHFFSKYGTYLGSLMPKNYLISGNLIVNQVKHYLDDNKRLEIAREIVFGIKHNILKTLEYYRRRGKNIFFDDIKSIEINPKDIKELISIEGRLWSYYYTKFNYILSKFKFLKREKKPPKGEINSLISYGNSILYTICLTEIYNTYLDPSISYLHEPSERRHSLALDIAELFKPLFVSRTIFSLINRKKINESCFSDIQYATFLNDKGKKIFLEKFNEKLKVIIYYPSLKKKISYRRLIRLECYKLIKHIIDDKKYKSFRMWW